MSSFVCIDCNKTYLKSFHTPMYRTFADSFDSTIGDDNYLVCKYCVKANKINNTITAIVTLVFLIFVIYFNTQREPYN